MRSSTTQLKLDHREPIPHGFFPKVAYFYHRLPKPKFSWLIAIGALGICYPFIMFIAESEYFQVKEWEINGTERLTEAEVKWTLGINESSAPNIFAFQHGEAIQMLNALPTVQASRVEKTFPNTVEITLFERVPRIIVISREEMFVADLQGILFSRAKVSDLKKTDLPILSIKNNEQITLGDTIPDDILNQTLLYHETLKTIASPLVLEISEYHLDESKGLSIILRQGTTLLCGMLPPSQTIPKYESLIQQIPGGEAIDYIDLRIESHIPYKLGNPRPAIQSASTN
ncbi:MAG: cell division protein FtsQ/DivIB [Sumerlaeia bacterium]